MTAFVRALNTQQEEAATKSRNGQTVKGLTADESYGNIFAIHFAGHDTTANTLAFSMLSLAANPEVQDWIAEELQEIRGAGSKTWDYSELFYGLKRCRAVLVSIIIPSDRFE